MVCILDYNLLASASTGFAANLCSNSGFSLKWNVVNKISLNWLVLIQQQTCWLANGLSLLGVKPMLNVNGDSLREPSQVAIIISVVCRGAATQAEAAGGLRCSERETCELQLREKLPPHCLRTVGGHETRSICHAGWITSYEPDNKQLLFC